MKKIIIIYALLGLAALYSSTDILYLKADYLSGLVKIQWQSSSEVNVKEFVIEKSSDNISFYKLTSEMPKGSSSAYTIFDLDPHSK
ncbi:MAG: hypothetical protein KKD38_09670, partial [Candidatus Delongbacteria bacterium]|nr:hypothetical protein [Candidatus Delongbacteria bacterium]MCG2760286.1 hypothetical protein [Candidatus Delongbacteria bacterium]